MILNINKKAPYWGFLFFVRSLYFNIPCVCVSTVASLSWSLTLRIVSVCKLIRVSLQMLRDYLVIYSNDTALKERPKVFDAVSME
jgi:hypothetical protein